MNWTQLDHKLNLGELLTTLAYWSHSSGPYDRIIEVSALQMKLSHFQTLKSEKDFFWIRYSCFEEHGSFFSLHDALLFLQIALNDIYKQEL